MDYIYHKNSYIKPCKSFTYKLTNGKSVTWNYNKFFDCDIFDFIRKLRLTYRFRNSICHDESIVKPTSTFSSKPSENQELEKICKTLMETEIKMKKSTDNISSLRNGFQLVNKKNNRK